MKRAASLVIAQARLSTVATQAQRLVWTDRVQHGNLALASIGVWGKEGETSEKKQCSILQFAVSEGKRV